MTSSATEADDMLRRLVPEHVPAAQLVALRSGEALHMASAGEAADNDGVSVNGETLFDLASLTKVVTAMAFMALAERNVVSLDSRVSALLGLFGGTSGEARRITWRHLLTHTAGLPAEPTIDRQSDAEAARLAVLSTTPSSEVGKVCYSDVGFMLLGFGIEAATGLALDEALRAMVLEPAGISRMRFRPDGGQSVAPTEVCPWRRRRLRGEVHDENAAIMGGVAGHAGLFGAAQDVARLGQLLLEGGPPVLSRLSVSEMTREHATDGAMRRGLGLSLWSPDPEASSHPFGRLSYGHTGFTGTSMWADPERDLVVVVLTNAVYRGRSDHGFTKARIGIHRSIVELVDRRAPASVTGVNR